MAAFVWGDAGAQMTPEAIAAQRKIAQAMMARGGDYSPVQSWAQGAARVAEGLMGGLDARAADAAERRNQAAESALLASLIPGAAPSAPVAPAAAPAAPSAAPAPVVAAGDAASAIAAIESGGKYDKLGPVTRTGDRAYGKYQVMGNNIPEWTRLHLGRALTPDQFLASPQAQDAVFKGQFGQYEQKYGPPGAAKAWFAGERGMNNPNARDQLGTTVAAYADKFARGYQPAVTAEPAAAPAPVQAVAQAMPQTGVNPRLMAAMASPYVSEGTKKVLGVILQTQLAGQKTETVDLGNKVAIMDQRGNVIREIPKGEPNRGPTFGETGEIDPQTGQPVKGWIDPRDKSVVPYRPQPTTPAAASTIPPVPPGVDPKVWREAQSKRAASEGMPASGEDTSKLRNEIQGLPSYKNIAQAAPVYKSMLEAAGRDTRAADVNMIYGMAKIMDPGSVVRESEMSVAQAIATLPQQLQAAIKSQMTESGRLTPELRQQIMMEARSRIGAYQGMFDQDATMYRGIAQRNRMNEADVLPSFGPFEEFKPVTIKPPAAAVSPTQIDDLVKKYLP